MSSRSLPYDFTRQRLEEEYNKLVAELGDSFMSGEAQIMLCGTVPAGLLDGETVYDTNMAGGKMLMGIPWDTTPGPPKLIIRRKRNGRS